MTALHPLVIVAAWRPSALSKMLPLLSALHLMNLASRAAVGACCGRLCAVLPQCGLSWILQLSIVERAVHRPHLCCKAPLIVSCDTNGSSCHGQCQHVVIVVTFVSCETFAPSSQAVLSHAGCLRTCAGITIYFVMLSAGHFSPLVRNPEVGCATLLTVCHLSRFRLFGGAFSPAYSPHCFFVQLVAGL